MVMLPAATFPHKGHRFLLRLMAERWTDDELCLVMTGGTGLAEADVAADIERLGLSDRVLRLGRVSANDRDGAGTVGGGCHRVNSNWSSTAAAAACSAERIELPSPVASIAGSPTLQETRKVRACSSPVASISV